MTHFIEINLKNVLQRFWYKWIELSILYLILPLLIIFNFVNLKYRWFLFALIFIYIIVLIKLMKPTLRDFKILRIKISKVLRWVFLYSTALLLILLLLYFQDVITLNSFAFYLIVLIVYPLVSAPIQEIFFRSFFFYRYSNLTNQSAIILLNILLFAFYHKIYGGWISVILSLAGGIIITFIYLKYNSYWWACICHGILGIIVFVTGLGKYFTDLID
jgi:uncharacterized protein